mgnify:FL=1
MMTQKIIFGVPSFWIERLPEIYALEKGLFDKRNIDLEIKYYFGGPELVQAVNSGEVHIGNLGFPPFLKGYIDGFPAKIIGSANLQQLDHYLVAHPDIKSISDLKGKRIGILSSGSCDSYFIRRILAKDGLEADKDVELKPMGSALNTDLDCFLKNEIDAGFVTEPMISLGEYQDIFRILARVGDYYPRYQWGVIFASNEYLKNDPAVIQKIMDAYREACNEIYRDPDPAIALGAKTFKVKPEIFKKALTRNLNSWVLDASIDVKGLQNAIQVQKEMGVTIPELDISKMVQQM